MEQEFAPLERVRRRLALVWFCGAGLLFALLTLISVLRASNNTQIPGLWAWFLPLTVPVLSLVAGLIGGSAALIADTQVVKRFWFQLALTSSILYLAALGGVILMEPTGAGEQATKMFAQSNYLLVPLQCLILASMGILFTSARNASAVEALVKSGAYLKVSMQSTPDLIVETVQKFPGSQLQDLLQALADAYPNKTLEMMLRTELDQDLGKIAGGTNSTEIIFNLIIWAEARGRLKELIQKAYAANPENPRLREFVQRYGYTTNAGVTP